jgi:hypothetical protein
MIEETYFWRLAMIRLFSTLMLVVFIWAGPAAPAADASSPAPGPEFTVSAVDVDEYMPDLVYDAVHDETLFAWYSFDTTYGWYLTFLQKYPNGATMEWWPTWDSSNPRGAAYVSIARDPDDDVYLAVWSKDVLGDGSDWDVYGQLLLRGDPLDNADPFPIAEGTANEWQPRVAYAGTSGEFLVTWWVEGSGTTGNSVRAQRVAPDGSLAGSSITVSSGLGDSQNPDIAYNRARNEYLIVYQYMDTAWDVYGARLTGTGSVIGGGSFGIAAWSSPESLPRVAATRVGNEWGITWQSENTSNGDTAIYARRMWVDGSGVNQFAAPVLIENTTSPERAPDIAAYPESNDYLVTWESRYTNGYYGILAKTLDTNNVMGPAIVLCYPGTVADRTNSAVAGMPDGWVVAWQHVRDNTSPAYQDIHARQLLLPVFADGFESGNVGMWSGSTP